MAALMHNMLYWKTNSSYIFTRFKTEWFRFPAIQNSNGPYYSCLYDHMNPVVII